MEHRREAEREMAWRGGVGWEGDDRFRQIFSPLRKSVLHAVHSVLWSSEIRFLSVSLFLRTSSVREPRIYKYNIPRRWLSRYSRNRALRHFRGYALAKATQLALAGNRGYLSQAIGNDLSRK